MRLPTASALGRAMACEASCVGPRATSTSPYAERGTAVHGFLHAIRRSGRAAALKQMEGSPWHAFCESIDVARLPMGGDAEPAYAWNHITDHGRLLGLGIGRDYSGAEPDEYCGTADLVEVLHDRVRVDDYKTGYRIVDPSTWQLRLLGLAAARAHGASDAQVGVITIPEDGAPRYESVYYSGWDLDGFVVDLRKLAARIHAAAERELDAMDVREGDHCRYCEVFHRCPAKTSLVRTMVAEFGIAKDLKPGDIAPMQAGAVWLLVQRYRKLLDAVEAKIEEMAASTPLPIPDGRVLAAEDETRESIDGAVAYGVLLGEFGPEIANRCVAYDTSKAALKRELGPRAERAIEAIRAAGGIRSKTAARVKPRAA